MCLAYYLYILRLIILVCQFPTPTHLTPLVTPQDPLPVRVPGPNDEGDFKMRCLSVLDASLSKESDSDFSRVRLGPGAPASVGSRLTPPGARRRERVSKTSVGASLARPRPAARRAGPRLIGVITPAPRPRGRTAHPLPAQAWGRGRRRLRLAGGRAL
jgi:hypothetical protein